MVFIGLDNGSKKFGISILDPDNKTWYANTVTRTKSKSDAFNSMVHPYDLWDQLKAMLPKKPTGVVIGIEKYFLKKGRGKDVLPWMQGFIAAAVYEHYQSKLKVVMVGSQDWKKVLIGFRTSGKEFVEDFVNRQARAEGLKLSIGTQIKDKEDTYDAMGIAFYLWKKSSK